MDFSDRLRDVESQAARPARDIAAQRNHASQEMQRLLVETVQFLASRIPARPLVQEDGTYEELYDDWKPLFRRERKRVVVAQIPNDAVIGRFWYAKLYRWALTDQAELIKLRADEAEGRLAAHPATTGGRTVKLSISPEDMIPLRHPPLSVGGNVGLWESSVDDRASKLPGMMELPKQECVGVFEDGRPAFIEYNGPPGRGDGSPWSATLAEQHLAGVVERVLHAYNESKRGRASR